MVRDRDARWRRLDPIRYQAVSVASAMIAPPGEGGIEGSKGIYDFIICYRNEGQLSTVR